ncbi:MAG: hypothetical protein GWN07_41140, partial [Actinobacteria bacterium]|nr:hypothetical protein [Actinomycetota bacterium]NIS37419.1 hypothetical protein [Actinomycetota bacterium]NIU71846.1 hypothetical protein [Actinomycetota bacterium]NIW33792.1 hypothetical protein [Actinomycetota bacterium]NIX25881.1 hypothetical protein [Actinomycetota bacterium]
DGARGVDNIITLVRSATDAERAYGLTWYAEAAEWIADMAAVTHHTERTVAGVVAA